jgi:hypothetical protein
VSQFEDEDWREDVDGVLTTAAALNVPTHSQQQIKDAIRSVLKQKAEETGTTDIMKTWRE